MKKNSDHRNPIPAKLLFSLLAMWLLFFAPGNLQCRLFPGMPEGNPGRWIGILMSGAYVVLVAITFSKLNHSSFLKRSINQLILISGFLFLGNSMSGYGGNVHATEGPPSPAGLLGGVIFMTESIKGFFLVFGFAWWCKWKR